MAQPFETFDPLEEVNISMKDYMAELYKGIRPNYERMRTRQWNRWECLHWLHSEGAADCSFNYCDDAGLIEEVLLQKAGLGL